MSIQIDKQQVAKKRRIGVVGVGHMGAYHAEHYLAHENVELVGVVDIDVDKAKAIAASCNCAYFTESKDLIGKVDAVSIAVPSTAHLEVAEVFLSEGIHVLIEKPLALIL
jgi:predicted dehydrogenase